MADTLFARGDLDGARNARFNTRPIRIAQGITDRETAPIVMQNFAGAYRLAEHLARDDAIAAVGLTFGQMPGRAGATTQATTVLTRAPYANGPRC